MDSECRATNKQGNPCSAAHFRDGWCRWHHPDLEAERKAARVAGGKAKSNSARARRRLQMLELSEIDGALCTAMMDVLSGTLEPGIATAAATVARTIQAVRVANEHEQRISDLEAASGRKGIA